MKLLTEEDISEEDKEFLEDISELSEEKQNGIIAYIINREKIIKKEKEAGK